MDGGRGMFLETFGYRRWAVGGGRWAVGGRGTRDEERTPSRCRTWSRGGGITRFEGMKNTLRPTSHQTNEPTDQQTNKLPRVKRPAGPLVPDRSRDGFFEQETIDAGNGPSRIEWRRHHQAGGWRGFLLSWILEVGWRRSNTASRPRRDRSGARKKGASRRDPGSAWKERRRRIRKS